MSRTADAWVAFRPRSILAGGLRTVRGWRLKTYFVNTPTVALDQPPWSGGMTLLADCLPQPPQAAGRAGLGVLIAHPGATHEYLVGAWWDNENELFPRTFVRRTAPSHASAAESAWRAGGDRHSFCVWDLEVLWFERGAWIECMLGPSRPRPEDYLARTLSAAA